MSIIRKGNWGGGIRVLFCDSQPPKETDAFGGTYVLVGVMTKKDWDGVYKGIYRRY